jgi:hypothetical protein
MLIERSLQNEISPISEPRMLEPSLWSKFRPLCQQCAPAFNISPILTRHIHTCFGKVKFKCEFNVGYKCIRLAEIHFCFAL